MRNHVFFGVLAILAVYASSAVVEPEAAVVPAEPVTVVDEVDVSAVDEVSPLAEGVERSAAATRNLNVGTIAAGNRLLYSNYFIKYPMVNAIQSQDITYRGNTTTRITAIRVNEVGYTQWASARITGGGVNFNWATVRLSTARGYGYYFLLEVWGR